MRALVILLAFLLWPGMAFGGVTVTTMMLDDAPRRAVSVLILTPDKPTGPPILFSSGANLNPERYLALLWPLAQAGHVVLAPRPADAQSADGPKPPDPAAMLDWRRADLEAVLAHPISGARVILAGHSAGALAVQRLATGASPNPRIVAVVALSPPGPVPPMIPATSWDDLHVPQLVITGRRDALRYVAPTWQAHLVAHERAAGPSYVLVAGEADHYFGNIIGRTENPGPPQQAAFALALQTIQAFLGAYGLGDRQALDAMVARGLVGARNRSP